MPPREWPQRLSDMQMAIDKIEQYTEGHTYETFQDDALLIDASIWNLVVIGEAANNVPLAIQRSYPNIEWIKIRGMRNVVVHQYFQIDLNLVWNTFRRDLPRLEAQLHDILADE
jgi:uncharacterized protein with HEPN domain